MIPDLNSLLGLTFLAPLILFWNQTRSFVTRIFGFLIKSRILDHSLSSLCEKELWGNGILLNADSYNRVVQGFICFLKLTKEDVYMYYKQYSFWFFLYKNIYPVLVFPGENPNIYKLVYIKYLFPFEKFVDFLIEKSYKERIEFNKENKDLYYNGNDFEVIHIQESVVFSRDQLSSKGFSGYAGALPEAKENTPSNIAQYSVNLLHKFFIYKREDIDWIQKETKQDCYVFTKQGKTVLEECNKWAKNRKFYIERNIPYRRGYLLHSAPGAGKSSLAYSVAKKLGMKLYVFDLSNMSNKFFLDEIKKATIMPGIFLFEDIDNKFNMRENLSSSEFHQTLTFDFFINALSGVDSIKEKLIFITTNCLDKIDPALLRPGRVDKIIHLENLNQEEKREFADRFFDNNKEFVDKVCQEGLNDSTAEFENRCTTLALENFWK